MEKPLKKPPLRIIIIAVCVTAAIITGIVLGVVFSNNLRKANVDKINLGDSYERVVKILDDPMDSLDSKYYWFKGAKDAEEALEMELTGKPYTLITVDFAEKDDVKTVKSVEYEVVDGSRLVVEKQTLLGSHSQYAVTEVIDYNTLGVKLEYTNGGWIKTRFDGVKQIADTSSSGIKTFVARYDEEEYEFRLNVVEPEKIGGKDTVLISYVDGETTHYQTLKKNSALTMRSFYKEGYTSYVIDQDKQKVLDGVEIPNNVTYNIVWSANQYKVSFGEIVPPAEFEIDPVMVTYDAEYQLPVPTKEGYIFAGWMDANLRTLTYPDGRGRDVWTKASDTHLYSGGFIKDGFEVTTTKNISEAGTVNGAGTYNYGTTVTLSATVNEGYGWLGWYDGDTLLTTDTTYAFYKDIVQETYTARWSVYERNGNYIYFGSYPQTKVTDTATKNALGGYNSSTWTSYGYYIEGNVSNYMYYIDKEYNGEKYRGVYFTQYRPYYTTNSSSADYSCQDDNGYSTSTVYWFKYEPIKWLILTEDYNGTGNALVLADMALDSQAWQKAYTYVDGEYYNSTEGTPSGTYANNYKYSTIRKWLNDTFYNTAFTDLQKDLIQTTTVDNSVASTGYSTNQYACEDTQDKIFLPSYVEVTTYTAMDTDDERYKQSTDYAKAQGCYTYNSSGSQYDGNCYWWLRSPNNHISDYARYVYSDVYTASNGVAPALVIALG